MTRPIDAAAPARRLTQWMGRLRDRVRPTYLDWSEIPDEAPSPYRARLRLAPEQAATGMEVAEREVVRGTVTIVYEIRCACRRRWFQRQFERVQVCPRCQRAVLIEPPPA